MDYISGWCRSTRRLDGVTAIVTGCNTGIGKETVRDFYNRGARVIMACRNTSKAEDAKNDIIKGEGTEEKGTLVVEELDLSKLSSIRSFVKRILVNEPNISILVNNAGVMMCPQGKTEDGFETHMGTNHYGHVYLTLLLLPRLKKSGPSRIVCVSSYIHYGFVLDLNDLNMEKIKYDPLKAYSWSKIANILFAKALANKLKERNCSNVTTYSLHPGVIRTEISRHFSETFARGATWTFNNMLGWFLKSPKSGAQTTIYCAVDEACATDSGLYYSDCKIQAPSRQCQSNETAEELLVKTIEALPLRDYDPFGSEDPGPHILQ